MMLWTLGPVHETAHATMLHHACGLVQFSNTQHVAAGWSRKHIQHVAPNNVASIWPGL